MTITDAQRERLPKAVQRYLDLLERNLAHVREELEQAQEAAGFKEADTMGALKPLTRHHRVHFSLQPGKPEKTVEVYVEDRHGRAALQVRSLWGELHVIPSAANSLILTVEPLGGRRG